MNAFYVLLLYNHRVTYGFPNGVCIALRPVTGYYRSDYELTH